MATKQWSEADGAKMDKAAASAISRLGTVKTAADVAHWIAAYKNEAGIKRLVRGLLAKHGCR